MKKAQVSIKKKGSQFEMNVEDNSYIQVTFKGVTVGKLHVMSDGDFYVSHKNSITLCMQSPLGNNLKLNPEYSNEDYICYDKSL